MSRQMLSSCMLSTLYTPARPNEFLTGQSTVFVITTFTGIKTSRSIHFSLFVYPYDDSVSTLPGATTDWFCHSDQSDVA